MLGSTSINPEIFRAYDIRGIVDHTLTEEAVFLIGKAIGSKVRICHNASDLDYPQVIVGRDGRLSGERLSNQLKQGIIATGCEVIDIGLVPTPLVYFAAQFLKIAAAVIVTGSHNPPDYNGLKIVLSGKSIYGEQILALKQLIEHENFIKINKNDVGRVIQKDITAEYIKFIINNVNLNSSTINNCLEYEEPVKGTNIVKKSRLKVVIDCGNGAAAVIAEPLFQSLGIECVPLYCNVDGNFPNHHPDPAVPENLYALQQAVINNKADLGFAFDGDGDRLGVVDNEGNIVWPDRYLMLFAKDILAKKSSVIIYDVKCTNKLHDIIMQYGGVPLMWKTGHSVIKAKMRETNALLAGEMSGHVFFNDRCFQFDDALYTAARLLELMINSNKTLKDLCVNLPESCSTPEITIKTNEQHKHYVMNNLLSMVKEEHAKITTIDGLRLDFSDSWGILRMSNTTSNLTARFEAVNSSSLAKVKQIFKQYLLNIDASLDIPF
jgi:phosphomannomutase / phosphoglucomutase